MKKGIFFTLAISSIVIGLYPIAYFLVDEKFGLLNTKSTELLNDSIWRIGFYTHIGLGGLSLLVGWMQFNKNWRVNRPAQHRFIGKIYVLAVLFSALAGIFIGTNATGGLVPQVGFVSLGMVWLFTTIMAFLAIRRGEILLHQKLMIFSYAACFAAVTLRIWLPLLVALHHGDFLPAYRIVAWLCWVPNMAVAWLIVRRIG
jgi:uncharacterized membrane protein